MNNILIILCIIFSLFGNSLRAQETSSPSLEEPPAELTMEQVCEQSADADGIAGKAREAYMANCLASLTNITPEEEENPQDTNKQQDDKTELDGEGTSSLPEETEITSKAQGTQATDGKHSITGEKHSTEAKK